MTQRIFSIFAALLLTTGFLISCKNDPPPAATNPANAPNPQLTKLNALLEKDPNNDSLLYRRASVYYQLEGYDEALADVERALQLDSMQPMYYHLLADVMLDYSRPNDSRK
ncbi:MAG: hypothetical protein ABIQ93_10350, partial [Saprospiraceae bacterium]